MRLVTSTQRRMWFSIPHVFMYRVLIAITLNVFFFSVDCKSFLAMTANFVNSFLFFRTLVFDSTLFFCVRHAQRIVYVCVTKSCTGISLAFCVIPFVWKPSDVVASVLRSLLVIFILYFISVIRISFTCYLLWFGFRWQIAHDCVYILTLGCIFAMIVLSGQSFLGPPGSHLRH